FHTDSVIFTTVDNQERFIRDINGQTIQNPVRFKKSNLKNSEYTLRNELKVPQDAAVAFSVYARQEIKGIIPFIKAANLAMKEVPNLYCLMPMSNHTTSSSLTRVLLRRIANMLGIYSISQRADQLLLNSEFDDRFILTDFRLDIDRF